MILAVEKLQFLDWRPVGIKMKLAFCLLPELQSRCFEGCNQPIWMLQIDLQTPFDRQRAGICDNIGLVDRLNFQNCHVGRSSRVHARRLSDLSLSTDKLPWLSLSLSFQKVVERGSLVVALVDFGATREIFADDDLLLPFWCWWMDVRA